MKNERTYLLQMVICACAVTYNSDQEEDAVVIAAKKAVCAGKEHAAAKRAEAQRLMRIVDFATHKANNFTEGRDRLEVIFLGNFPVRTSLLESFLRMKHLRAAVPLNENQLFLFNEKC